MPAFAKKKYIKLSKGFFGAPGRRLAAMIPAVDKSLRYAYISRRLRPRDFKSEWIQTIGSAVRQHDINYSRFANCLTYSNILINRKLLADLGANEPYSFKAIVDEVKIQNSFQPVKAKKWINYSINDMVLQNLVIKARLPDSEYERQDKQIQTQFLQSQMQQIKKRN